MNNKYIKKYCYVEEIILDLVFCWCFSGTVAKILNFLLYFKRSEKKQKQKQKQKKKKKKKNNGRGENFKIYYAEKLVIFLFGEWN